MKVLAVSNPGVGHVNPMFPLCHALRDAGHEVRFATGRRFCEVVRAAGFDAIAAGLDWVEAEADRTFTHLADVPLEDRGALLLGDVFADAAAHAMVPDLVSAIEAWRPDLVLRNDYEFGSCVAAERCRVPHATMSICFFMPPMLLQRAIGEQLAYLRSAFGLSPYPATAMLYPSLYLTYATEALEPSSHPAIRHIGFPLASSGTGAEMLDRLGPRPLVYVSLGTVFNRADVFRTILDGLRDEPVNVVVTVGRDQDPADLGPQPPHVLVERYIPQDLVLARASLFITHSPFFTALSALRRGVPLLMVPRGGDQPAHAERLARHGLGLVVSSRALGAADESGSAPFSSESVRLTVRQLHDDAAFRRRAGDVARDLAALPDITAGVRHLEQVARSVTAHG
jgi:UDP:flavonoid glycosyltransferase YjiC (YdhE family)